MLYSQSNPGCLCCGKETSMTDLIIRLEQAIDGLLFPSESDAPLHVFVWRDAAPFSSEALLAYEGYDKTTPIQTTDLESFFHPVTTPQAWYGEEEQERMRRFTALLDLLKAELSDIKVYKVGTVAIDVYVVGRDANGNYLGLTTKVIET
jgi:hypothetical protein